MMKKQISCVEIDIDGRCDFQCPFCYFTKKQNHAKQACTKVDNDLSFDEIISLITEAGHLGVQKIILFTNRHGTDNDHTHDIYGMAAFIRSQKMQVELLQNGSSSGMAACECDDIKCMKNKFSCFITSRGVVFPCAGMPLAIGDLRKDSLEKIINNSEVIENLQEHEKTIKGPCRACHGFSDCYGCRGRTFALTGDYLGSDPVCHKNTDKSDYIHYLPMPVEDLIPQKRGMRLVSFLLKVEERYAQVQSCFSDKSPFIKKDGTLEEIAYMEIMAQSAAVMDGFLKFDTDAPKPRGFLIGGQDIRIHAKTRAGEKLITDIRKTVRFGNFGILSARIMCRNRIIAEGEIKIYQFDNESI